MKVSRNSGFASKMALIFPFLCFLDFWDRFELVFQLNLPFLSDCSVLRGSFARCPCLKRSLKPTKSEFGTLVSRQQLQLNWHLSHVRPVFTPCWQRDLYCIPLIRQAYPSLNRDEMICSSCLAQKMFVLTKTWIEYPYCNSSMFKLRLEAFTSFLKIVRFFDVILYFCKLNRRDVLTFLRIHHNIYCNLNIDWNDCFLFSILLKASKWKYTCSSNVASRTSSAVFYTMGNKLFVTF